MALHGLAPAYEAGLAPAVSARGGVVDSPLELGAWLGSSGRRVLVLAADHDDFIAVISAARTAAPAAAVMALLDGFSVSGLVSALHAGASTVGDMRSELETLAAMIEAAAARWASLPFEALDELRELSRPRADALALTERERELLRVLAEPLQMHEIAYQLHVSDRTAYRQRQHLYRKLGVSTRLAAVAVAYRSGVLQDEERE